MTQEERMKWFIHDRFGMFIHFGLYSIPARGEWVRYYEEMSVEDYQKYFDEFNPIHYDARKWAKIAKNAGMKYAVMTAKHHDGFCLFDSKLTDYKATNTKSGRDLIAEYVEAFRAEGLKVGLYYSLLDWHHPDYPIHKDSWHPMRNREEYKDIKQDFSRYIEYFHGQVRELLTNYGQIDLMWFDFSYDDMKGEKWEATKLVNMIRQLQPHVIIDNRLGGNPKQKNPEIYAGDYMSPEQVIPVEPITNDAGEYIPWELCITLNNHWGYHSKDKDYKTASNIIRMLVECVSKNGNMLLNVGPNAKGEIPKESVKILEEVGEWMHSNGESIYGAGISGFEKPPWGRYTQNGNKLYAHIYERGVGGPFRFIGQNGKFKSARLVADGSELQLIRPWNAEEYPNDAFIDFGTARLPDEVDTVIEFKLAD